MKTNEDDNSVNTPESEADNNAAPSGGDFFSIEGTETDKQEELTRQIEEEPGAPPATRNPAHLILVGGIDDDPPDWPDF
jgi:hypothetical protein